MRGKIGQDPMIIDVPYPTSNDSGSTVSTDSDVSSGSETPPSEGDTQDRRYVWKPAPDVPIPQYHGSKKTSNTTKQKETADLQNKERGRTVPKLDTDIARNKSAAPLPPLERARSPYASGPQDRKPKPERLSGDYLLSPDTLSPRKAYAESPRTHSQYIPRPVDLHGDIRPGHPQETPRQHTRPSLENQRAQYYYAPRPVEVHNHTGDNHVPSSPRTSMRPSLDRRASELPYPDDTVNVNKRPSLVLDDKRRPTRPTIDRRASELPYPPTPPSAGDRQRFKRPDSPLDDSDSGHARNRAKSGQVSPQTPPKYPPSNPSRRERHHERKFSAEYPLSHGRQSLSSLDATGPPINLSSMLSGAAVTHTLNAMLSDDHTAARRASPRPSPRPSPLASPHGSPRTSPRSSPPGTPPSESTQHRTHPVSSLKRDSPSSRPSSPLTSRSSVWTAEPDSPPRKNSSSTDVRPGTLKSRNTAPGPTPRVQKPDSTMHLDAPGITVRSPSPAKHTRPSTRPSESHRIEEAFAEPEPDRTTHLSSLTPSRPTGRQRSASSADVRPRLSVHATPYTQGSESLLSPSLRSRPASPSPQSPVDRYRPSTVDQHPSHPSSRPSRTEGGTSVTRARSKSRSHAPEPSGPLTQPWKLDPWVNPSRSGSIAPAPAATNARSRSSAPDPVTRPVPIPPQDLPLCPRPELVTGYEDWSTLQVNTAFAICPHCRESVFGTKYAFHLQPRPHTSRRVLCALKSPWMRLALILNGPDVKILSKLSDVTSEERSCPGDELAPRDWYRLEDYETEKHIPDFHACPQCVHSLEVVLPAWRKIFYRSRSSHSHDLKERYCSLRANAHRFGDYLNMMVESAQEADARRTVPNTRPICDLAKQLAAMDECPRDIPSQMKAWHIHPHLPEFTICQECYEGVVYPLVKQGLPLAAKIDKKPQKFPNPTTPVCCHLYSVRMRDVLKKACKEDNYEYLRHTALQRHMIQQDLLETYKDHLEFPDDLEIKGRMDVILKKWEKVE